MSSEDKAFIEKELGRPQNISVVANGVDLEFFSKTNKNLPSDPTVLFVGTFKWLPNVEAVDEIVKKIWPLIREQLPKAKLKIVGFSPTEKIKGYAKDKSIEVLGGIDDIRDGTGQGALAVDRIDGRLAGAASVVPQHDQQRTLQHRRPVFATANDSVIAAAHDISGHADDKKFADSGVKKDLGGHPGIGATQNNGVGSRVLG